MSFLHSLRFRIASLFERSQINAEMEEELRSHILHRADDLERSGLSRAEAERRARIEFGGYQKFKEECRETIGLRLLGELIADVRYGLRQLRRNPGFTSVAVITLALGIGANTAIFSLLNAVMLRSLPVRDPSQLVVFTWRARHLPAYTGYSSYSDCFTNISQVNPSGCSFPLPIFDRMQSETKAFSSVTAFAGPASLEVTGNGPPSIAHGEVVSGSFSPTLGVPGAIGRTIDPQDDSPDATPVIVLSHAYWQNAFGGVRSAIGRTVDLNNVPFTIVGVAAPSFARLAPGKSEDFWLPIAMAKRLHPRDRNDIGSWSWVMLGRLKDGVSLGRAQAAANLIFRDEVLHGAKPLSKPQDDPAVALLPAQEGLTGFRWLFSQQLHDLMFAVVLILLIASANVAGLLLARATTRVKEMAVRLAVGAARGRILRQLLTESVMLSAAGGTLGIVLAYWCVDVITELIWHSAGNHFSFAVTPDWRILVFTIAVSFLTGILFGFAPALSSTRLDLNLALKEGASTGGQPRSRRRFRAGSALVIAQVGLSMTVLAGAGLLFRTLRNLRDLNPGFDTRNVLVFGLDPTLAGYKDAQIQNLYRSVRNRIAALPGVLSASYSFPALLTGGLSTTVVQIRRLGREGMPVDIVNTGPGFFHTMRIPLLTGRTFTAVDYGQAAKGDMAAKPSEQPAGSAASKPRAKRSKLAAAPTSVLVNAMFVRKYLRTHNPLGEIISIDRPLEIIGVVADTKYDDLRRSIHPAVYVPVTGGGAYFELRTAGNPAAFIPAVRTAVDHVDSHLPLFDVRSESQNVDALLMQERLVARLGSFFGTLAVVLACVGLYGLLSYEVTRRTREVGLRIALGAQKSDVLKMVTGQGLNLVIIGVAIGIVGALGLTRFLSSLLYGVKPTDPLTFVAVSLILTGAALLACYIPARRATKVDPMMALRYE